MTARCSLVGDIGGTHCRFALARGGALLRDSIRTCATADFPSLAAAARQYLRQIAPEDGAGPRGARLHGAHIAVAGPVAGDRVRLTNQAWDFSIAQTRQELGLERLRVLNDFEAVGLALAGLGPKCLQRIGGGEPVAGAPKVALGPGTGYGAVQVIHAGGTVIALPGEGGHVSLAPATQREMQVCQWLLDQGLPLTCEQVLSGPGLALLYRALAALRGGGAQPLTAAQIQALAVSGADLLCREALELFCTWLGTAARDQVLGCLARGGAYIGGGIVQRFLPFFRASGFRRRFDDHPAMRRLLEPIPVYVITEPYPGLVGAAAGCGV